MSRSRGISLPIHGALEMLAAPAVMAAPFLLDLGPAATMVSIVLGASLLGLALQVEAPSIPLSAHVTFDYGLAAVAVAAGLAIGIATGEWLSTVFLVGIGVAQVLLTASTRFSRATRA